MMGTAVPASICLKNSEFERMVAYRERHALRGELLQPRNGPCRRRLQGTPGYSRRHSPHYS
jgi:hypothetical protein